MHGGILATCILSIQFVRGLYVLVALLSVTTAAPLVLAMSFEDEVVVAMFSEAYSMGIVM